MIVIQAAYNQELASGNKSHDSDLKILEASCDDQRSGTGYLCQVTFMSTKDPAQRLYYDIISIDHSGSGWALKSGLCKR